MAMSHIVRWVDLVSATRMMAMVEMQMKIISHWNRLSFGQRMRICVIAILETLVLTHKQFTNSLTLLKNLRRRFDVPIPNDIRSDDVKTNEFRQNVQKRIQLKVIKSLRDWMKTYWDDDFLHDLELQKELALWLADLRQCAASKQKECPWIAPLSNMVNKEYERFKLKSPNQSARANALKFSPKTGVPTSLE